MGLTPEAASRIVRSVTTSGPTAGIVTGRIRLCPWTTIFRIGWDCPVFWMTGVGMRQRLWINRRCVWPVMNRKRRRAFAATRYSFQNANCKMKNAKLRICIGALSLVLIFSGGCTEQAEPGVHPDSWLDPGADNSHMARIASSGIGGCQGCHGQEYLGGTSGVSCYTCHAGGPSGHPQGTVWFFMPDSSLFHGNAAMDRGFNDCARCHGQDLRGVPLENRACSVCHSTEEINEWLAG